MLALRSIAGRVLQLQAEERELAREIETITRRLAPQLLDQPGVGPHAAAQLAGISSLLDRTTDLGISRRPPLSMRGRQFVQPLTGATVC